jgi:hypothetical protein
MRSTKLMLALLGFAAALFAADPFVGTWKMDPAKTKYKEGTAPKEQTVVISGAGDDLNVKVSGTTADGKPISLSYTVPAKGGQGKTVESPYYDAVDGKRHGTNEREVMYKKGGKTVFTTHSKVSKDGNSMTTTAKGMSSSGQKVDAETYYSKVM